MGSLWSPYGVIMESLWGPEGASRLANALRGVSQNGINAALRDFAKQQRAQRGRARREDTCVLVWARPNVILE